MIISNESMDFNDPKKLDTPQLFDDPQLFHDPQLLDDQLEAWTLIIQKSTVIPPSLMVLFFLFLLPAVDPHLLFPDTATSWAFRPESDLLTLHVFVVG